jgi:hypothetical protein
MTILFLGVRRGLVGVRRGLEGVRRSIVGVRRGLGGVQRGLVGMRCKIGKKTYKVCREEASFKKLLF